jgi:O-antigen/teichoic acid export membrane protein
MFGWAILEKNIPFLVSFAFTIILARLVAPEIYGLVAMTAILTALAQVMQGLGLNSALIQREQLVPQDTTTAFAANVVIGSVLALLMVLSAGLIAQFFGRQEVVSVVYANATTLVFVAFGSVQMAMLQREYRFRAGLLIELSATLLSGGTAIWLALKGCDLLALLALMVIREATRTLLLWMVVRWRPRGGLSFESWRQLWGFGRHMVAASLYHHFAMNLTGLLLGKFYSTTTLGLYGRAQSLQLLPLSLVTQPLQRVAFPLYSRSQSDHALLRELLRRHTRSIAPLAGLITAGLSTCANEIMLVLVGEAWIDAVPMLQILGLAAFFNILFPLHSEANKAIGAGNWFLKVEFFKKTLLVLLVSAGIYLGLNWLLWLLLFASFADYGLSATSSVRFLNYSWREQLEDILPALFLTFLSIVGAKLAIGALPEGAPLLVTAALKGGVILSIFCAGLLIVGAKAFPEIHLQAGKLLNRFSVGSVKP